MIRLTRSRHNRAWLWWLYNDCLLLLLLIILLKFLKLLAKGELVLFLLLSGLFFLLNRLSSKLALNHN